MSIKRIFLGCLVVFLSVIGVCLYNAEKLVLHDRRDPSVLLPPSKEFNEWRKSWEKSRF